MEITQDQKMIWKICKLHKQFQNLYKFFLEPKPTIVLLQTQSELKSATQYVSDWLLGYPIKLDRNLNFQSQNVTNRPQRSQHISITNEQNIRIIGIDISWSRKVDNQERGVNLIQLLKVLKLISNSSKEPNKYIKVYLLKCIKELKSIGVKKNQFNVFSDNSVIYIGGINDSNLSIPFEQWVKCSNVPSVGYDNQLKKIKKILTQKMSNKLFQQKMRKNDKVIKIANNYLVQIVKKFGEDQLKCDVSNQFPNLFSFLNISEKKAQKNFDSQQIQTKYFGPYELYQQLYSNYKIFAKKWTNTKYKATKQFLCSSYQALSILNLSQITINNITELINILISENELISETLLELEFKYYSTPVIIKDQWNNNIFTSNISILLRLLSVDFSTYTQNIQLYDEYLKILDDFFDPKDYKQNQRKQLFDQIICKKIKANVNKGCLLLTQSSFKSKIEGIQSLFEAYKYRNFYSNTKDYNFNTMLKRIGEQFYEMYQFKTALQIYMQLKYVYKVEQCVEKILEFILFDNRSQKIQLYHQLFTYFKRINNHRFSEKYQQLIIEEVDEEEIRRQNYEGSVNQKTNIFVFLKNKILQMKEEQEEFQRENEGKRSDLSIKFDSSKGLPHILKKI